MAQCIQVLSLASQRMGIWINSTHRKMGIATASLQPQCYVNLRQEDYWN